MSDEFGTINVRRGERAREIEVLRQHYRQHREALARMTSDAPTEHLAAEYQRLIVEIDRSLGKLGELEGAAAIPPPAPGPAGNPRLKTEPGMRPLVTLPIAEEVEELTPADLPLGEEEPRSRVPLILAATLVALVLIGWLVWRASSDRGAAPEVVAESTAPDTSVEEPTTATATVAPATGPLAVAPPSHDYGVIRKGTRATRQFEIANNSDEPVSIAVDRSACRCLYYEHAPVVPPKSKESLTVTIDGAKAKVGELREAVRIKLKNDPTVATTVDVKAMIQ
ncbi:MAG TPA: DUF1573 domain-containing protein [Thermoanaerobaculia bacterium]|jgi:hypothetical protein|nr:DUF1573 domain-containing protein [Thermoanaerobaculia bacterium]